MEDDIPDHGAVQAHAVGLEDTVRPEMGDDEVVSGRSWGDDESGEEVGVDDGEVMDGGEEVGNGGFPGGYPARQADDWVYVSVRVLRTVE